MLLWQLWIRSAFMRLWQPWFRSDSLRLLAMVASQMSYTFAVHEVWHQRCRAPYVDVIFMDVCCSERLPCRRRYFRKHVYLKANVRSCVVASQFSSAASAAVASQFLSAALAAVDSQCCCAALAAVAPQCFVAASCNGCLADVTDIGCSRSVAS